MIFIGDGAAEDEEDVFGFLFAKKRGDARDDDVVGAGEDGEADAVDVLLDGGRNDHFGGLAEAGVDDFHTGVAEGARDDFGAAVVAVEAWFGDENAYWWRSRHRLVSIAGARDDEIALTFRQFMSAMDLLRNQLWTTDDN